MKRQASQVICKASKSGNAVRERQAAIRKLVDTVGWEGAMQDPTYGEIIKSMRAVTIKRVEAPELQGFARNGNVDSQAMAYKWQVIVDGKIMATEPKLRIAKDAASYYGTSITIVR